MTGATAAELADWFDRHAAALVLYARQWVGRTAAEDIVQDAFVRLAAKRVLRPEASKIRAYLLAMVRHGAIDAIRSERRRQARDRLRDQLMARGGAEGPLFAAPVQEAVDADEIERALSGLPADEREIVTLRIWAGATFQEIAEITGMPLSTVHVRYRGALDALRTFWEVPCRNH